MLDPFLYVSPTRFDQQLGALRSAGFVSASLAEISTASNDVKRKAVITFDDGCRNVFEKGLEILQRHQFRAIQFLVAGFVGKHNEWDVSHGEALEPLMDENQVREWLAAGQEIGSHTTTHPNLKRLSEREAREEILGSKKRLEDTFGISVRHFCYPFGKWNEAVRDLVGEAGYETACTVNFGVNTPSTPKLELKRIVPLSGTEWLKKAKHRAARVWRS